MVDAGSQKAGKQNRGVKRVLLVEDDALLLKMYKKRLEGEGYEVVLAADGKAALTLVNEEIFDLVVLDLMLPGVGGVEVLKQLKANEKTKKIPVVVLTNLSSEKKVAEVLDAGGTDYLSKVDTDLDDMVQLVRKRLGGGNGG